MGTPASFRNCCVLTCSFCCAQVTAADSSIVAVPAFEEDPASQEEERIEVASADSSIVAGPALDEDPAPQEEELIKVRLHSCSRDDQALAGHTT